jgi:hypothetical protein
MLSVMGVLGDLLEARLHDLTEEHHRERHLRVLRWWGDASSTRDREERPAPLDDERAA